MLSTRKKWTKPAPSTTTREDVDQEKRQAIDAALMRWLNARLNAFVMTDPDRDLLFERIAEALVAISRGGAIAGLPQIRERVLRGFEDRMGAGDFVMLRATLQSAFQRLAEIQ
jgi:hypothetical protein